MGNVVGTSLIFFYEFSFSSICFINSHENASTKMCISSQLQPKPMPRGFNSVPRLVVYDDLLLRYESFL